MDLSSWKSSIFCNEFEGRFILGSNCVGSYVYCLSLRLSGVELTWNAYLQDAHMGEQQGGIEEKKNMASMAAVGGAAVSAAG